MTQDVFTYRRGQRLPGVTLPWYDGAGDALDLSTGYTFTCNLYAEDDPSTAISISGITGAAGSAVIAWGATDLDRAAGRYILRARATEVSTSKPRDYNPSSPPIIQIVED